MISIPTLPQTALASLSDWERSLVTPFLDKYSRIIPFWQSRLSFPSMFVYGHVLKRLYRDTRFIVPLTHLQDPFVYPFKQYVDSGNWREFKTRLIYDPTYLLKLIEKLLTLVVFNPDTVAKGN